VNRDTGVLLAKTAGFCPGVKKAIDRVMELARAGRPVYTLGPLVHNAQVLKMLEEKGVHALKSLSDMPYTGGILVLRAHGVTPELEREARARGVEIFDATCPLVKKVHSAISKYKAQGFSTVIVGDAGHAEVVGLQGYAGKDAFVVSGPEEAAKLPRIEKAHVVAQTTQEADVFEKTVEVVRKNSGQTVVSNTICKPSRDRQKETAKLAQDADMVIVVGGRESANTARLTAVCKRLCRNVVQVETEDELEPEAVRSARQVAITAGASTPASITDKVKARVQELRKKRA
jgi:4-hydroxy-3-methylbut-2-enyl diphosphate reductase